MGNKDLRMAIMMMVIFIVLFGLSFTFQKSGVLTTHTTAAFFPRVVLSVAMFLTLIIILQNLRKGAEAAAKHSKDAAATRRVVLSMIWSILFGFGVSFLGTLVSMGLYIGGIMLIWGFRNWRVIAANSLITPVVVYLIFKKVLLVQLPAGILL
ncbi:MAG: tripartite tricarboxylate transporter TctB family protein [Desulfofustis sp.]|jgi:hypothetical protein|nr:tripartite tricarboxylate transporter TctB family protein [Desulfofustis sp.]